MNSTMELLARLAEALARLAWHPLYYVGILFVILQYRKQIALERKLFATRLHSLIGETWRTVVLGIAAGFAGSVALAVTGVKLGTETIVLLWVLAFLLSLVRVRYLCLAYAAGFLGLIHSVVAWIPSWKSSEGIGWLKTAVDGADLPSLLCLVAVLHLCEGFLVRNRGERMASPLFVKSKRGKIVGGYHLQGFWPLPLFLLVPSAGGGVQLPWEPLFAGGGQGTGWNFLVFPAVIGFSQMTLAFLPKDKLRQVSGQLFMYALLLLGAAVLTWLWPVFGIAASLLAILLHEAIVWYGKHLDDKRSPLFVNDPAGMKILAVLPGSAAAAAGIVPGETVRKVNGESVQTKEELHLAMRRNPAFCKMEVLNHEGQSKFVSRALYDDEHHQLGLILSPDDEAPFYVEEKPFNLASYLWKKTFVRNRRPTGLDM